MSRPVKCRKVCSLPGNVSFIPAKKQCAAEPVVMTVEEYETVRLIDRMGFTQEKCAGYMKIARTTVQQIYFDARKKLSLMLVEGRPLVISGGDYTLCDGKEKFCGCGGCRKHCATKAKAVNGKIKG